jgi:hypothetical protein
MDEKKSKIATAVIKQTVIMPLLFTICNDVFQSVIWCGSPKISNTLSALLRHSVQKRVLPHRFRQYSDIAQVGVLVGYVG